MRILGLSGSTHDSAASLIIDGEVINAIEEERISRIKKAPRRLPVDAAKVSLEEAGLSPNDIDAVAYFIDPDLHNRDVYKHILFNWDRYILHPVSYRTSSFLKRGERYANEARTITRELGIKAPITFVRHHLTHAASTFFLSPFEDAMILTIDNMGEFESTMLAYGSVTNIVTLKQQRIPHSLGMLYAMITDYLGFRPWYDEGKVMALAAYGKPIIPPEEIVEIKDGSFELRRPYQMIETINHERTYSDELVKKLGPPRKADEPITDRHKNIAASIQNALEETCKQLVTWLYEKTGLRKLCLAGGVALNCKMNGELYKLPFIDDIYVIHAAGDAGSSLGAAVHTYVNLTGKRPKPLFKAGLGKKFDNSEIEDVLNRNGLLYKRVDDPAKPAAEYLMKEGIITWFEGRSEFGPRALGHRSVLALPNKTGIKDYINERVKGRELWRPLAPSILETDAEKYFPHGSTSRFMNIAHYGNCLENALPQIFHVDGTARIQAVYPEESDSYARLLEFIKEKNGYPILINTSFNLRNEPIVDSPQDAIASYTKMPLNTLVIGNYVVRKHGSKS